MEKRKSSFFRDCCLFMVHWPWLQIHNREYGKPY